MFFGSSVFFSALAAILQHACHWLYMRIGLLEFTCLIFCFYPYGLSDDYTGYLPVFFTAQCYA